MADWMFFFSFIMLVFLPCAAALFSLREEGSLLAERDGADLMPMRALGPVLVRQRGAERDVTEEFVIRSFPKGLKERWRLRDLAAARAAMNAGVMMDAPLTAEPAMRTRRRVLMMNMLADKAQGEAWMAQAMKSRARYADIVSGELGSGAAVVALAREAEADAYKAEAAGREAFRRVAKAEAMLQGRADLEMREESRPVLVERRKTAQAA